MNTVQKRRIMRYLSGQPPITPNAAAAGAESTALPEAEPPPTASSKPVATALAPVSDAKAAEVVEEAEPPVAGKQDGPLMNVYICPFLNGPEVKQPANLPIFKPT